MNDQQMEKLITGIRENENRSQSLSETLMGFNEAFTKFMAQIEAVGKLREFEESHEKIVSLEEHIAGIKEDLELINTAQMVRLNELGREIEGKIQNEFKETLKHELKEELMKGFEKILEKQTHAATAVEVNQGTYVLDNTHHAVFIKGNGQPEQPLEQMTKIYESKIMIAGISRAYDSEQREKVLVHLTNGEIHILP